MLHLYLISLLKNHGDFSVSSSLMTTDSDFSVFEKGTVAFKLGKIIINKRLVKWEKLVLFTLYV